MKNRISNKFQDLIPSEAFSIGVTEDEHGIKGKVQTYVELRRWGEPFKPISYQRNLIKGIVGRVSKGKFSCVLSLPTGAGKTLTASQIVLETLALFPDLKATVLWIAPQKELLYQGVDAAQGVWWSGHGPPSIDLKVVMSQKDYEHESNRPTILYMTPVMAHRLRNILKYKKKLVRACVFDEAHHAAADIYKDAWNFLARGLEANLALGLTATPTREEISEVDLLRNVFSNQLVISKELGEYPVKKLIQRGVLSRPKFIEIPGVPKYLRLTNYKDKRTIRSIIYEKERWDGAIATISSGDIGQTVVYAYDREYGKAMTAHLRVLGVKAEFVDGLTAASMRYGVFERFRNKETKVIVNVGLLIEGVDCPAAESVVLTYPTQSRIRLRQMVGRVLRGPLMGGGRDCRVYCFEGSQKWLDNILYGEDYHFLGWEIEKY